jgi:hypothetical protein
MWFLNTFEDDIYLFLGISHLNGCTSAQIGMMNGETAFAFGINQIGKKTFKTFIANLV